MKKLLYLFLLSFVIVACNKEDDSVLINAVTPVTELAKPLESTSVDLTSINVTLDRLIANAKNYSQKDNSTRKPNPVGSSIKLASTFTNAGIYYEFLFSDDINNCDPDGNTFEEIYLVLNSDNFIDIKFGSLSGPIVNTISRNLAGIFTLTISEGLKAEGSEITFVQNSQEVNKTGFTF